VNQQVTYSLLKAAQFVKDNRLPPVGFTTTHLSYDSIKIVGNANDDTNFNKYGTYQGGTGGDSITYLIPALPKIEYRITTEVCYQTVKTQLVDNIRNINHGDINKFVSMYDALPNIPFIMKQKILDIVTGVDDEKPLSNKFILEQNYPNPFNPSTKISWQSPVGSWQTLNVYDVLGNEVATLVDEYRPAGSYEVKFSAEGLTSGIYFYKLQVASYVETKKMILLR
jgi:hypothetical protein